MSDRTYSQDEVAAIIARVADRERRASQSGGGHGLTLAELERACGEAGLDPAHVREAAAELDAGALARASGAATSVAESWADGPPTAEGWQDAVDHLRVRYGTSSGFGLPAPPVGGGWEWTHQSMSGLRRTVSVSPREGRTRVRVVTVDAGFEDPRVMGAAIGALVGAVVGMLLGALLAETLGYGDLVGVLAVVLTLLTAVTAGAVGLPPRIRRGRAAQARDARALAEDVAGWVAAGVADSAEASVAEPPAASAAELLAARAAEPLSSEAPASSPALSLDLDAPAPEDDSQSASSRRTRA